MIQSFRESYLYHNAPNNLTLPNTPQICTRMRAYNHKVYEDLLFLFQNQI